MSGLMVLRERIDATEALIAIDLDNRRNELVAFDLVSACWTHSSAASCLTETMSGMLDSAPQAALL